MDKDIFKKLKVKPNDTSFVFSPPDDYPFGELTLASEDMQADFVHLFVKSQEQFEAMIKPAIAKRKPGGLFWISYMKSTPKNKCNINRDSLWDLAVPNGVHPVAQVALDETWSAVRFVENKPGEEYARPKKDRRRTRRQNNAKNPIFR